jgi:hypothetical protein
VIQLRGSVAVDAGTVTNREIIFPAITATLLDEEVGNVQRVETSAWSVQTRILGEVTGLTSTSNIKIGGANNLEIIENTGTISAQILCNGAVSTGNTCSSVNELQGIVFDVPRAGKAMACVSGRFNWSETSGFTEFFNIAYLYRVAADGTVSAGDIDVTWTPLSQIINQQIFRVLGSTGTYGNQTQSDPYFMCGIVDLVAGKNALAAANSQSMSSGNPSTNFFAVNNFQVFPIEQQLPQALITQGRVYNKQCYSPSEFTISSNNTFTYAPDCDFYLPAGKYLFELSGLYTQGSSPVSTAVEVLSCAADSPTTLGQCYPYFLSIGIARREPNNFRGSPVNRGEVNWAGGIVYQWVYMRSYGGTVTAASVRNINFTATRLD